MKNKAIILLSGGLDSVASLGAAIEKYNVCLALTFDYGQRTAQKEIEAGKNIAAYYNIEHKVIKLDWLKEITNTSLVNTTQELPQLAADQLDNPESAEQSAKNVWVPNRNGVFINIAASYADSMDIKYIIFGANKEEATTFPDNSQEFIEKINQSLAFSTLVKAEVIAPLAAYDKKQIVKSGVENNIPFNLIRSCYTDNATHCGKCESCMRLKRALKEVFVKNYPIEFME